MSNRCLRPLAAFVAIVYLCIPGRSQSTEISHNYQRRTSQRRDLKFARILCRTGRSESFNETHRTDVQFDGSFQMRDIRSGTYTLRVTTLSGTEISSGIGYRDSADRTLDRAPAGVRQALGAGHDFRHAVAPPAFTQGISGAWPRRSDSLNPAKRKGPSKNSKKPSASHPSMRMPTTILRYNICAWAALKRPLRRIYARDRHCRAEPDPT